jgi:hypothetical protein
MTNRITYHCGDRTTLECCSYEIVPIKLFATDGKEQLSRGNGARVDGIPNGLDARVKAAAGAPVNTPATANDLSYLAER